MRALPLASGAIDDGVARQRNGRCTFLQGSGGDHRCEIHHLGGHGALPLTCRMFPRLVLHDPRGTFISLSHFCPTAVGLLFEEGPPAAIVDAPAALAGDGALDGLNAQSVWPPLLRPGLMMDVESYGAWERLAIELLTRPDVAPFASIDALRAATARLSAWTPSDHGGAVSLADAVRDAFGSVTPQASILLAHDRAVKRWLAARLFACWMAYQGDGLQTIVRYVRACHDIFTIELARDDDPREAIRRSDHLIVHESSSQQMATLFNDCA